VLAVITNIDREHLEHYGSFDRVLDAFVDFANKVPFYGAVVVCGDDAGLMALRPRFTRRVVTYGLADDEAAGTPADLQARDLVLEGFGARCQVVVPAGSHAPAPAGVLGELRLQVPGRHNLLNALAAVAVGLELGIGFRVIAEGLAEFRGAERRFQVLGEAAGVLVVDDYGHHPTEIGAVLDAARAGMARRVVLVFQPHRFTRTRELLPEFAAVLARADALVLTEIYAANEDPIPGVTSTALAEAVVAAGGPRPTLISRLEVLPEQVAALVAAGDLVITLGAGSIGSIGPRLLAALRAREGGAA
jgi:UDP-N-acetylmuramate--alanine ligase